MVDLRVEIMAWLLSKDLKDTTPFFKMRTPWGAHDFRNDVSVVVTREELETHKKKTNAEISLFLEVWSDNSPTLDTSTDHTHTLEDSIIGLAKPNVNDQLRNQVLSPSIQWLDISDPIQNSSRGKILVRIHTIYINSEPRDLVRESPQNLDRRTNCEAEDEDFVRELPENLNPRVLPSGNAIEYRQPYSPPSLLNSSKISLEDKDPISPKNKISNPSTARSRRIAANIYGDD